ncbi:ABC transporter permease [Acidiphilium sp.]|uniref:ABC transporter permease n=1 Tax=Acidiphilium sp. TaxID=527 RepID=UPI00258FAF1B|nr:ABC transporter permease [Acidiphilium sp.]
MESLKSDALEPSGAERAALPRAELRRRLLTVYGLPILTVALIVLFSLLLPDTFPTAGNMRAIFVVKSVVALLALAALPPMIAGRIDLTVGYGIVLWSIIAISLQVQYHWPWPLAVLAVLGLGGLFGLMNGMLVEIAQIDSFIATLGTGTIIYALAEWYTGGEQVVGTLPAAFTAINDGRLFGLVPFPALYVLVVALLLWLVTERMPLGRVLYAIGANRRAAELNGIAVRRHVILVFVASGVLTAFASVVLAAQLRIGATSLGLSYLLPALVGAFLGSTTIRPGRVNVWGTVVAELLLAVGISGIEQLGGAFFVSSLFNGVTLVVSIGLAGLAQRRRGGLIKAAPPAPATTGEDS